MGSVLYQKYVSIKYNDKDPKISARHSQKAGEYLL